MVINFDLPNIPETYVHRIGRTGRAKNSGVAISFCDIEERPYLRDIQKLIDQKIPVVTKHPFADEVEELPTKKAPTRGQRNHSRPKANNDTRSENKKPSDRRRNQNSSGAGSNENRRRGNNNNNSENKSSGNWRDSKRR